MGTFPPRAKQGEAAGGERGVYEEPGETFAGLGAKRGQRLEGGNLDGVWNQEELTFRDSTSLC